MAIETLLTNMGKYLFFKYVIDNCPSLPFNKSPFAHNSTAGHCGSNSACDYFEKFISKFKTKQTGKSH